MTIFENLTRSKVKECYIDINKQIVFVVEPGQAGKAIGKNGVNIRKISDKLHKKVKVIEFNPDVVRFVANAIYPLKSEKIYEEDGVINITTNGPRLKALLIGRDQRNIKELQKLVSKYFDVKVKIL